MRIQGRSIIVAWSSSGCKAAEGGQGGLRHDVDSDEFDLAPDHRGRKYDKALS